MRKLFCFAGVAAFLLMDWSAGAAVAAKKKAPARKTTVTHKKSAVHRTSSRRTSSRKKSTSTRHATQTWRNRQMTPTQDRYKQIQEALVSKGFLSADDANGTWGASSVDALKRFQAEQNIEANGKINSLSLIALGLGPKHESAPVPAPVPAQAALSDQSLVPETH